MLKFVWFLVPHRNTSYQAGLWIWTWVSPESASMRARIYTGILLSAAAKIRDTPWFWRRTKMKTLSSVIVLVALQLKRRENLGFSGSSASRSARASRVSSTYSAHSSLSSVDGNSLSFVSSTTRS